MKRFLCLLLSLAMIAGVLPILQANAKNQDDPWSVHGQDYYGRTALAKLPNSEALLFAYDQLAEGIEAANERISVYNGKNYISLDELQTVMDAYRRDYVQHFWLGNNYSISYIDSSRMLDVIPSYIMSGDTLAAARAKYDAAVNEILSGISSSMSEYEKELYIHDRLAERITYTSGTANAHNSYGAIVEGKCVCEGYAEAFQYLLEREGIHSFIVIGDGKSAGSWGAHAWNYVRIDGQYYHVDLTWDDTSDVGYHGYFNITDEIILRDHRIDTTSYELPSCDSLDANYYVKNGGMISELSVDVIVSLMKKNNNCAAIYYTGDISDAISWYKNNIGAIVSGVGVPATSYGWSYLGNEIVFRLVVGNDVPIVKVKDTQGEYWFSSVSEAIGNCNGGYVMLLADSNEDLTISKDLYLDLNGFDLTGSVTVADGATLYGMDAATNDYNCSDDYGTITNLSGNYARYHKTNMTGINMRYLAVEENGVVSFHRFFAGIVYMSLQPSVTGVGYKAIFAGDYMVIDQLDEKEAFGFELKLQNNDGIELYKAKDSFVSGRKVSVRIDNFDIEQYGEAELYAKALLKLKDGTVIEGVQATMTFRTMLEKLNENLSVMNAIQFEALKRLLDEHPVIQTWNTDNLYK